MERSEFYEAMDACRAGSDDLGLPELAPLAECLASESASRRMFDRLQRFDRRISTATLNVPVPAGMAERILARVQIASSNSTVVASNDAVDDAPCPAPATGPNRRLMGRRGWMLAAVAASVAMVVSVVLWPRPTELTADELLSRGGNWAKQLWTQPTNWILLPAGQRQLPNYPLAAPIVVSPSRWADVGGISESNAVAYDLSTGGGQRAILFVIRDAEIECNPTPPISPQSSTEGLMIGCWRAQGVVYVLVVDGDERSYKNLLKSIPPPPFA
jgi:hypothetical protein